MSYSSPQTDHGVNEEKCYLITLPPLMGLGEDLYTSMLNGECEKQDRAYGKYIPAVNLFSNHRNVESKSNNANESEVTTTTTTSSSSLNPRADCNIISLNPLTTKYNIESSMQQENTTVVAIRSGYEHALAIILAIQHLREGDGSLIKEVDGLNERCNIDFKLYSLDT
jgi:hypothetical protein